MNAIEIQNLSKSFRGMYAVEHLSMTVPVGAIYVQYQYDVLFISCIGLHFCDG